MPCSLVEVYEVSVGTYGLHLQDGKVSETSDQLEASHDAESARSLLRVVPFLGLLFSLENGDSMLLEMFVKLLLSFITPHPGRQNCPRIRQLALIAVFEIACY
jgi:hypothetical protein